VNQVTLIGRVGQDPVIRGSQEKPVTLFQLATSQSFKSPDGVDRVYVSGSINYSQFTDKNNQQVFSTSIIADNVINLTKAGGSTYTPPLNNEVNDYEDVVPDGKVTT
ncbi:hypothetical protein NP493_90g05059, partial [Ridgeia piscesae]